MAQVFVHYFLHFGFVAVIAYLYDSKHWLRNLFILWATMLVDLDHLLANPIFDPDRCSIGFHPLHSYPAIIIYSLGLLIPRKIIRLIFIGLLFHMLTDGIDCLWTCYRFNL